MRSSGRPSRPFSLSVLSVVGVLVIGSVLIGLMILQNARITSTVNALQALRAAVATYHQNYDALPGDDPAADTRFSTAGVDTHGGGDGRIGSVALAETFTVATGSKGNGPGESANLWQHLRAAGLIKGQGSDSTPMKNAFGGVIGVQNGAFLAHGIALGTPVVCASGIPGAAARAVDRRLDDGDALTGALRGGGSITGEAVPYADNVTMVVCLGLEEPKR